jgi:hypothetical protein
LTTLRKESNRSDIIKVGSNRVVFSPTKSKIEV